jgi:hypothetical protein
MARRVKVNVKSRKSTEPVTLGNGARPIGAAEKLLLGLTPAARVTVVPPALRGLLRSDGAAVRLEVVQAFLARNPEVKEELEQEALETWHRVGEKAEQFAAAVSERRARLLSAALLSNLNEAAPPAIERTYSELARYLAEAYGMSG